MASGGGSMLMDVEQHPRSAIIVDFTFELMVADAVLICCVNKRSLCFTSF